MVSCRICVLQLKVALIPAIRVLQRDRINKHLRYFVTG